MVETVANYKLSESSEVSRHSPAELFWVWAVQHWAHSRVEGCDPVPKINTSFRKIGFCNPSSERLAHLFTWWNGAILEYSVLPYEFGCLKCGTIGIAERVSLCAIGLSQSNEITLLKRLLANLGLKHESQIDDLVGIVGLISENCSTLRMFVRVRPEYFEFFRQIPSSSDELMKPPLSIQ